MQELSSRVLTRGLIFGEGPRWRDGKLYVADMHAERVIKATPEKIWAVLTDENTPILPEGTTQRLNEFDRVFIQIVDHQAL